MVGNLLGGFRLVAEAGPNVYHAVAQDLAGPEAVVRVLTLASREQVAQVQRALQAYDRVHYWSLIPVLEWGHLDQTTVYYAEEKTGGPLPEGLEPARVLGYLIGVLEAAQALHRAGLVLAHAREEDIACTPHGGCLRAARPLTRPPVDLRQCVTAGAFRLHHESPEEVSGARSTPASDQFTLGSIAYRALSGRRPFETGNLMGDVMALLQSPPDPLEGVEPVVNATLLRMLEKDPAARFPDLAEIADRLRPLAILPDPTPQPQEDSHRCPTCNWLNPLPASHCRVCGRALRKTRPET